MNRPAVDRAIIPALAALLYASYTEEVPTEAECDAMRGHVATLKGCVEEYQRRVDELERPAAPDPEAVERRPVEPSEADVIRVADALYDASKGGAMDRWVAAARLAIAAGLDPSRLEAP
jgi:hypothetical protein